MTQRNKALFESGRARRGMVKAEIKTGRAPPGGDEGRFCVEDSKSALLCCVRGPCLLLPPARALVPRVQSILG